MSMSWLRIKSSSRSSGPSYTSPTLTENGDSSALSSRFFWVAAALAAALSSATGRGTRTSGGASGCAPAVSACGVEASGVSGLEESWVITVSVSCIVCARLLRHLHCSADLGHGLLSAQSCAVGAVLENRLHVGFREERAALLDWVQNPDQSVGSPPFALNAAD